MNKGTPFFYSIFLLLLSCNGDIREGFTNYNDGLAYQLHTIGEPDSKVEFKDYLKCTMFIENDKRDTIFYDAFPVTFQLKQHSDFDLLLTKFNLNDSLSIELDESHLPVHRTSIDVLFNNKKSIEKLLFHIKILEIKSAFNYKEDSFSYFNSPLRNENRLIEQYLKKNGLDSTSFLDGIFFTKAKKTLGNTVKYGDHVKIEFVGRFFDGRIFDATDRWSEEFIVEFGKPMQIIKGLEIALSSMNEGEVAKIILPSHLAFGKMGSKAAKVPPFTPIIYELKLTEIY